MLLHDNNCGLGYWPLVCLLSMYLGGLIPLLYSDSLGWTLVEAMVLQWALLLYIFSPIEMEFSTELDGFL